MSVSAVATPLVDISTLSKCSEEQDASNERVVGTKRKAEQVEQADVAATVPTQTNKKTKVELRMITVDEFVFEMGAVLAETGKPAKSTAELSAIFHKYEHVPSTLAREWSAVETVR